MGIKLADLAANRFFASSSEVVDPEVPPLRRLHPFAAPLAWPLALLLLESCSDEESVILDPMAGSGTVAAAARQLGRECIVSDIDPLPNLMLTAVSNQYDLSEIQLLGYEVVRLAHEIHSRPDHLAEELVSRFDKETRRFLDYWFPEYSKLELMALWLAIEHVCTPRSSPILSLAFSRTIIAKISGCSWAIDLPHTRPHRRLEKAVPHPFAVFPRMLKRLCSAVASLPTPIRRPIHTLCTDARNLPLPGASVDMVLTSSPYASAIDYMRAHKFSLVWMGYPLASLRKIRAQMIGTALVQRTIDDKLTWLESYLPDELSGRRRAILRRYFYNMNQVLRESYRVLKPGGVCVLVLGPSTIGGHVIDIPNITLQLGKHIGFRPLGIRYRRLDSSRRSLPFPIDQANSLCRRMVREAVIGLGR